MPEQLSFAAKLTQAVTVTDGAAGSTNINGATLDMSGAEGVQMIVQFGVIVASGVQSIKAQQGDQSDGSDMSDLLGTGQTVADTDDEKTFYIDLYRPEKRFVRLVVLRATQNATLSAIYQQYGAMKKPVTHEATVIVGEQHSSPAEGTA